MTRPANASFEKFFPSSARARDSAAEREKARIKSQASPTASTAGSAANGHFSPSGPEPARLDEAPGPSPGHTLTPKPHPNGLAADDNESLTDALNTVGSSSSHESTSSSLGSGSGPQNHLATMKSSSQYMTPLTSIDSPSSHIRSVPPTKAQSTTPLYGDGPNGSAHDTPDVLPEVVDRIPPRDLSRPVMGVQCTYDPLLDLTISSSERRKAKPIYKEFGLVRTIHIHSHTEGRGERRVCCEPIG
jgi:histone-lysine N-methyltransferase SETD1